MSDSATGAAGASPAAAPTAPAETAAPEGAEAPVKAAPAAEPAPRVGRKAAREARRANPNHDADMWARAGAKAAAKEAAKAKGEAPAKAEAAPERGADGKFLPREGAAEPAKAPAKAEPPKAAEPAKAEPAPEGREAKAAKLKELAAELGFKVDAGAVTAAERYQLRAERREMLAKVDQAKAAGHAELEKARAALAEESKQASAFMAALKAGDPDGMAAAAGHKDWNALQEALLEAVSDPHYARIKALEAEREAEKKEREEAKQRFQEQQRHEARARANAELRQGVAAQAKGSSDPLLAACAGDPMFIETLIGRQAHHYDPVTETTCSLEEALDDTLPNGQTLRQIMRSQFDRLAAVFGAPKAPEPVKAAPPPVVASVPAAARAEAAPRPAVNKVKNGPDPLIAKYAGLMKAAG